MNTTAMGFAYKPLTELFPQMTESTDPANALWIPESVMLSFVFIFVILYKIKVLVIDVHLN